jgi:hypothetical protein
VLRKQPAGWLLCKASQFAKAASVSQSQLMITVWARGLAPAASR